MESKLFSIGDIVTVKTHPYLKNITDFVISGDHLTVPPLVVITEVYQEKQKDFRGDSHIDTFKYKCLYFSVKQYKFIEVTLYENDLKLIIQATSIISAALLQRGDRLILKSSSLEMGKRKSSLSYLDDSGLGRSNTTINSLLSYLGPVTQVTKLIPHKSKSPVQTKTGKVIREVHYWDVTVNYFDPTADRFSEFTLPLEAFELVPQVDEELIDLLSRSIINEDYLAVMSNKYITLLKPANLSNRAGRYYLRGYDYLANRMDEFPVDQESRFEIKSKPFLAQVPTFDILKTPASATPEYIISEIVQTVNEAKRDRTSIRIKYKNRNDQISHRTVKEFQLITVDEGALTVTYLSGYCYLRRANRHFRVDRIQALQQLAITY